MLEEGEVEAGEEIIKVASGAEQMTVAQANSLLYLPGHRREELERALRIPALSAGWKNSFQALLQQELSAGPASGNPGLAPSDISLSPPAWRGFRPMRVTAKARESIDVISVVFEPADGLPLTAPLPVSSLSCACNRSAKRHHSCAATRFRARPIRHSTV